MGDIHPIGSSASAATLRAFAKQTPARAGDAGDGEAFEDRVEISELATALGRMAGLSDDRAGRIVEVRKAIAEGTYETPEKLDIATERLLDEFPP